MRSAPNANQTTFVIRRAVSRGCVCIIGDQKPNDPEVTILGSEMESRKAAAETRLSQCCTAVKVVRQNAHAANEQARDVAPPCSLKLMNRK
jgi:hypothetical protein